MFERPADGERVLLVHVDDGSDVDTDSERSEFQELATSAGLEVLDCLSTDQDA